MDDSQTKQNLIQSLGTRFGNLFYTHEIDTALDEPLTSLSIADAYRIQDVALSVRESHAERVAGYKVGCTSAPIRKQFGLTDPVHGRMLEQHIHEEEGRAIPISNFVGCAIEPELAIRIGRDLDPDHLDDADLIDSIDYLSPSIEVHNFTFWFGEPTAQELIASNCLFGELVVGDPRVEPRSFDFANSVFSVYVNENPVTKGPASAILGGPLVSLRWLVQTLGNRGAKIQAGHWVIPGSPVELVRMEPQTRLRLDIEGVGSVSANFQK